MRPTNSKDQGNGVCKIIQSDVRKVNLFEAVPMEIVKTLKQRSNVEVFKMDRLVLPKIDKEEDKFEESDISETIQNVASIIDCHLVHIKLHLKLRHNY